MTSVPVPESRVELAIPTENLRNLPDGASFAGKKGQAGVKVTSRNDTLYVSATCDSLQILVESQYREIDRLRQVIEKQKEVIEKPTPLKERIAGAVMYILVGMVITFIIQFLWKIKKKTAL